MSNKEPFSNNNTKKGIGLDYQKLIALGYCINAKKNESIWIECFGDIATDSESLEVKHHLGDHNLTSNSPDAWKTLKNYFVEFSKIIDNDKLILFTTSSINSDSIFFDWNSKTASQKYSILNKHDPAEGVKSYKDDFFKLGKSDALKVLGKFIINSDQLGIIELKNEILDNPFFALINDEFKYSALQSAYGYISLKALDDLDRWEINSNDFIRDMKFLLRKFTQNNIPFPIVEKDELEKDDLEDRNFLFIEKIKKIGVKDRDQASAVEDYIKANLSAEKLLAITPIIFKELKIYDSNIERILNDEKSRKSYNLKKEDLSTDKAISEAREVFFECINKEHPQIINVSNTQRYYRNGRIHSLLENTLFDWEYKENDL